MGRQIWELWQPLAILLLCAATWVSWIGGWLESDKAQFCILALVIWTHQVRLGDLERRRG
jgi:hypothetical protein